MSAFLEAAWFVVIIIFALLSLGYIIAILFIAYALKQLRRITREIEEGNES